MLSQSEVFCYRSDAVPPSPQIWTPGNASLGRRSLPCSPSPSLITIRSVKAGHQVVKCDWVITYWGNKCSSYLSLMKICSLHNDLNRHTRRSLNCLEHIKFFFAITIFNVSMSKVPRYVFLSLCHKMWVFFLQDHRCPLLQVFQGWACPLPLLVWDHPLVGDLLQEWGALLPLCMVSKRCFDCIVRSWR